MPSPRIFGHQIARQFSKAQNDSRYFLSAKNSSLPSQFLKFKSGGWVEGAWSLLWVLQGKQTVNTSKCKLVDFRSNSGERVKAWKC